MVVPLFTVMKYIHDQKTHHAKSDFKAELLTLLNNYQAAYEERYVWD